MSTIQAIGFANKFYTLWEIEKENTYITDINGKNWITGENIKYMYIKNISMELETVIELYPRLEIWEDLRGKSRKWTKKSDHNLAPNIMSFGKYYKHEIESIVEFDLQYIIWVCGNNNNTPNAKYAMELPKVIEFFESKNSVAIQERNDNISEFKKLIENGEVEFARESNLKIHENFAYFTENIGNICVTFNFYGSTFKKFYYRGSEYGFPDIDGKYKTMKFKNLKYKIIEIVNEDEEDNSFNVNVVDVTEL